MTYAGGYLTHEQRALIDAERYVNGDSDPDDPGPQDGPGHRPDPEVDIVPIGHATDHQEPATALVYSVAELAAFESADEAYIVGEGILTTGGKLLIHGASGVGKTTLAHDLAGCLATGRQWLGRYGVDADHPVLCVQGELSLPEMASHAQQLVSAGYDVPGLTFARMTGLRLPEGEAELRDLVHAAGARIAVLDPWYRLFTGESSNAAEQVDRVFQVADRLLEDGTVDAMIVVHHSNVTGLRTAGSWVFEGWPSTILQVEPVDGVPDQRIVNVQKVRAPGSTLNGARLRLRLGESGYRPVTAEWVPVSDGAAQAAAIVAEAGGQLARANLLERLCNRQGLKSRQANKYLGEAVQGGTLTRKRDGKTVIYQCTEEL